MRYKFLKLPTTVSVFNSPAMKQVSVNYEFVLRIRRHEANECQFFARRELSLHSNANAKFRIRLKVIVSLDREE